MSAFASASTIAAAVATRRNGCGPASSSSSAAAAAAAARGSRVAWKHQRHQLRLRERRGDGVVTNAVTIYGSQGSRSPLVNWFCAEIGLEVANAAPSDASNPHPFKQVPALRDDDGDVAIFESGAVLGYLADKYGGEAYATPERRAAHNAWIVWANATLDPVLFLENERGGVVDTGARRENKRLRVLDDILATSDYLVDDTFSVADVAVASYLLYVPQFFSDVSFARYPNVARYMGRCASRDAYATAFGPNVQAYLVDRCVSFVKESRGAL